MYDEFFEKAHELMEQGVPFVTVTVVRADRPTSARAGDRAIVTQEGTLHGWIGGSCAQPTVIKQALQALAEDQSRLIRLSAEPDPPPLPEGWIDLPMTCFSGGTLEIFVEPQHPRPRLLIVGNLPVARALAQLGEAMSYRVILVDLDAEEATGAALGEVLTSLEEIEAQIRANTYVVVASHGYYDEAALEKILRAHPGYVGLVASPRRAGAVRDYLRAQGISDEELRPLKAPAGLDIGAQRGDEIALSIMAEIVQRRRAVSRLELTDLPEEPVESALDPVCGMEVEMEGALYTADHEGERYYFCCAGCQQSFTNDPASYLQQPPPSGEAVDPICQMTVDIASARYMSEYEGELFYFCCAGCKATFDKLPEAYAQQPAT